MNTFPGRGGEEPEELVLHVGEVEHLAGHRGLVGLEVQHERSVLDQVGAEALSGPPEQMCEPSGELLRVDRFEAEVVEEVLPQLELTELFGRDDDEHRRERDVALAQVPAEQERADRVGAAADHRTRPPALGLGVVGRLGRVDALERVTGPIEHSDDRGRRVWGIAQQRFHRVLPPFRSVARPDSMPVSTDAPNYSSGR